MQPLVSIIIPCLNSAPWLSEALGSCFDQTYTKIEVIFVDNGSTDDSVAVARKFKDARLLITNCEHKGASAARNEGLRKAQGKFIQFLDADDLISTDKIENQVQLLRDHPMDTIALSAMCKFRDGSARSTGIFHNGPPLIESNDPPDWLINLLNAKIHGLAPIGSWLSPRHLIDRTGPWNEELSFNDDGEYFARVVLASKRILKASSGIYYYRQFLKSNSLSSQQGESNMRSALKALDLVYSYLLESHIDIKIVNRAITKHYLELAYRAYPAAPVISNTAMRRVSDLGGTDYIPPMGSWKAELLRKVAGWKAAKTAIHFYGKLRR